jgi:AraC-like DNA-binding protein
MPSAPVTHARVVPLPRNLLDAMCRAGVDPAALALRLGLNPAALTHGIGMLDLDRFFCAAWTALDDPAFGLRAGCAMRPERFGVIGIAAMCSPDFGTALDRIARYKRLMGGDIVDVQRRGAQALVRIELFGPPRPYSQAKIDMELANLLTFGRVLTGAPIAALRVTLRQPAPGYRAYYDEVFGCPIAFEQADDSIAFASTDLARPLLSADPDVARLVLPGAEATLARLGDGSVQDQVRSALRHMLHGDEPTLAAVADVLCVSKRTLQRRLTDAALRFSQLVDQTRCEMAEEQLAAGTASIDDLAFRLGFSSTSSFYRAFKRWTGRTPGA